MASRIAAGFRQAAYTSRALSYPPGSSALRCRGALNLSSQQPLQWRCRMYSESAIAGQVEPPEFLSEGERKVFDMLKDGLQPTKLEVQDVSGGCGSMYALDIVSDQFKGLSIIKQHRLVNKVLGEEVKKWHGVQLKTKAP